MSIGMIYSAENCFFLCQIVHIHNSHLNGFDLHSCSRSQMFLCENRAIQARKNTSRTQEKCMNSTLFAPSSTMYVKENKRIESNAKYSTANDGKTREPLLIFTSHNHQNFQY